MSSVNRSTPKGGKGAKQEATKTPKNDTKVDTSKNSDHNSKVQPTAEQMRIAQIIDTRTDEPGFKDKIKQVMDATRRTEDEVCTALHDCDNDLDRAVNMLLEGMAQGEWETSVKKKKSRQPVTGTTKLDGAVNNRDPDQEDWDQEPGVVPERERSRTRGGGPPRMRGRGSLDNRGWRGRENKENERNLDDSRGEGYRRGSSRMTNGPGRSGRGGRGGGRLGPRTFQSRERQSSTSGGSSFPRSIDTWNNPGAEESTGDSLKMEKWGDDFPSPEDWDNEEYTGSLADTKVFTPSGGAVEPTPNLELPQELSNAELSSTIATMNLSSSLASNSSQLSGVQSLDLPQTASQVSQFQSPVQSGLGTLNAAQSEYLSKLTAQATENLKSAVGIGTNTSSVSSFGVSSASYPATSSTVFQSPSPPLAYTATSVAYSSSGYPGSNSYSSTMQDGSMDSSGVHSSVQSMPTRVKAQRPRVPPPSKIPSSAVEMPGDAVNSNVSYLDVQFGGLEFGSETSAFEPPSEQSKYSSSVSASVLDSMPTSRPASNIDLNCQSQATLDAYSTASQKTNQSSITSQMSQSQKLPSSDSMMSSSEHKSREPSYSQGRSSQALDMDKNEVGLSYSSSSTPAYQSYQNQKTTVTGYQPTSSYSSASYSSNVVTSTTSSYPGSQSQMSYASTGSSYSTVAVPSSYQNSSYSQPASAPYQTGPPSYPSISQASAFPSSGPSAYPGSVQSVYGASTGLGSAGYASTGAGQYQNNYGTTATTVQQNHTKLNSSLNTTTKEAQYDATTTASSNLSSSNGGTSISGLSSNVNASPALGSLASTSQATTKVTSSTGSKSGVVANIPPGVPPMLGTHQYIMSQGGLPFYQQPTPVYSYEDVTLMQQRIPHMATAYYDMSFQAPTSLATGRDAGLASVAYSMSDGRFTRTDNNASPVPSTLSQQNASQAHTQPMLNASGLPPGYAYYFQGGMMPGSFQYGTPPIYPLPPATNAHGSATSTQYTKPGSYSSGYSTGYDGLSQNQDFGKTGYVSSNQSQNKAGVGSNTGSSGSSTTDLSATMLYGKSHVALGKVNSYEKQGFHSGTPPPFNLPGSQSTPMAPGGAYAPQLFIPAMAPHQQHHSTTLMHQPPHQMDMRNPNRRSETGGSTNQRSQSSSQPNKSGTKQNYNTPSYWTGN